MIRHYIEQGTHEWHLVRLGKVTGSRIKNAIAKDNLCVIDELIAEKVSQQYDEGYTTEKMQRGTDLEPIARKEYEQYKGITVEQIGFLQSSIFEDFGISPDGLVGTDGAIEIKCPDTKKHVQYIRQAQIPNEYKHQVLGYFLVHEGLQWLDFVSYDPRFTIKLLFVHRVTREELQADIKAAQADLDKFFKKLDKVYSQIIF
jgi:predicted phage-related endonuclease